MSYFEQQSGMVSNLLPTRNNKPGMAGNLLSTWNNKSGIVGNKLPTLRGFYEHF